LKSYLFSNVSEIFLDKSSFSVIFSSFLQSSICIASDKFSTAMTFIQGITEASREFETGTKIFSKPFSFAQIVAGKTLLIFLKSQFKDNSQIKILFSSKVLSKSNSASKIPIAMGKSKLGQDFLMSAGARFTVILEDGSFDQLDFKADLSLSLLS
jgi:hypothetical protein